METAGSKYTIHSEHDIQQIIEESYDIVPLNCQLLTNELSEVYMIETAGEKYILKIYSARHSKLEKIKAEVELLNLLHEKDASISYPVKNQSDNFILFLEGQTSSGYGVLYTCAKGQVVYYMDEEQIAMVARAMATMHNITAAIKLNYDTNSLNIEDILFKPLIALKTPFAALSDDYSFIVGVAEQIRVKLSDIDFSQCSYGYCHYDLLPNNFHFDNENKVTFFDFELAGRGYLINDLVSFYAHYFLLMVKGRISQEQANRAFFLLIKNYTKVRPINSIEIDVFPYFGFAFWVFHLAFDFQHFAARSNPDYLKDHVTYIRKWVEWYLKDKL